MASGMLYQEFQEDLSRLLNKHSLDNLCSTPDFILAGLLTEQLEAYRKTIDHNIRWHEPSAIGQAGQMEPPIEGAESSILAWDGTKIRDTDGG